MTDTKNAFGIIDLIIILFKRKISLLLNFIVISIVAVVYAFMFAEKQFVAGITFFPPASESRGISSLLSGFDLGGVFGTDIMPEQIQTIFDSDVLRRRIIDEFSLYESWNIKNRPGRFKLALMRLSDDLILKNEEAGKMGISKFISYTLNAYHTSPDTCFLMANFVFHQIDSAIQEISSDRGHRDRIFVGNQLMHAKTALDSIQGEFKKFQISNKAYNVPEQIGASLKNYGQIRASIIANDIQIQRLQSDYNNSYASIASLKKTNKILEDKLLKLEKLAEPDVLIGLETATDLGPQYTNFIRDIEIQNELILLMSQEYEQAKLKETRNVSQLKVIDPAYVPDYKARPKRILIVATIVTVYMVILCMAFILDYFIKNHLTGTETYRRISSALKKGG
jgi:capsule polysaccharide export protein KpsE/RkpR